MVEEISVLELINQTDAKVWTEQWFLAVDKNPDIPKDFDTMIGWFANAIMAGYDACKRGE